MVTTADKDKLHRQLDDILDQTDDASLKKLARYIADEIKNQPQVMNIKEFCEINGMSRNFIMEHQDQFPIFRIQGSDKVMINMVKWLDKLRQ
jgi:hypothetical protein